MYDTYPAFHQVKLIDNTLAMAAFAWAHQKREDK